MYKQNQKITLVAKDGLTTLITTHQEKKLFASSDHSDFHNIKFPPIKTRIKKYRS